MSDIVGKLGLAAYYRHHSCADEIERLRADLAEAEVLIKWAKNLKPKSEARYDICGGTYETLAGEQIIEFHNRADNWLARRSET